MIVILKKIFLNFSFIIILFLLFSTSCKAANYYVSPSGNDSKPGTLAEPWLTIKKAIQTVTAGDTVYLRDGDYNLDSYLNNNRGGMIFRNSGTVDKPIIISNYPNEQAVIKTIKTDENYRPIICNHDTSMQDTHPTWITPKADYVHIIGTDVPARTLSNGVTSSKGLVFQGVLGAQWPALSIANCDYWEVVGVDFIEAGYGIFTHKRNNQTMTENSTDYWYVHDNRVYNYYRESGMQFNGDNNQVENNEIYKVSDLLATPYGCQHLNFLGDHNIIKGNVLSRLGSKAICQGILFEWDLSDYNTVEQNKIYDVPAGITFAAGDNNVVRNNLIYNPTLLDPYGAGIKITSYDDRPITEWPCNEADPNSSAQDILPANDPSHPDYQYYYNPRNCHSSGNQIYNNTIHNFAMGVELYKVLPEEAIIRNNIFSNITRGDVCFYESSTGRCKILTSNVISDHNASIGNFGFKNLTSYDFHLLPESPLINAGIDLGSLVPNDFDGNQRPPGAGFDVGAFEYKEQNNLITPTITSVPTITSTPIPIPTCATSNGDANGDGFINLIDYEMWRREFLKITNTKNADFNCSGGVDVNDFQLWRQAFLGNN